MTHPSLTATRRHPAMAIPLSNADRRLLRRVGMRAVATLVLSLVLASAAGAAQRSPSTQSARAANVQGKVARADLAGKLERATGSTFGGVWFDAATAHLHIGVTSTTSQTVAESVAIQAGLSNIVTATPVRSSSAELLTTQRQWNRKLAGLFARNQVTTALEPQHNRVAVQLSSSVPRAESAALERDATAAAVNVLVVAVASPSLGIVHDAKTKCNEWVKFKANCDPSITSGASIFKAKEELCSAGPLAINAKKERVMLTAGHCIGKLAEVWSALNTAKEEKAIGPVQAFVNGIEGEKIGDFAELLIEATFQTGKPSQPVFAVTGEWKQMNKKGEKRSYPVKGKRVPSVGTEACHVGMTSGESCGEIKSINFTTEGVEGFITVKEPEKPKEQLISEGGDSGGPWIFIEANNEALMEGVHSGRLEAFECVKVPETEGRQFFKTEADCKNEKVEELPTNKGVWQRKLTLIYYPLVKTMEKSPKGVLEQQKLELLTTANEVLPPAIKALSEETFPITFTFTSGETKFETVGKLSVLCTADKGSGELENGASGTIMITLTGCKSAGIGCRSENAKGEKDAVETILETGAQLNVVNLLNTKKELAGGIVTTLPEPVKLLCGVVKGELRGSVLGLVTPINKEILTTETAKLESKQKEGKVEAGECKEPKETCEKLTKEPLEAKIGEKLEGAGEQTTETISLSKMIELAA